MNYSRIRFLRIITLLSLVTLFGCTASVRMGKELPPNLNLPDDAVVSRDLECRVYFRAGYNPVPALPDLRGQTITSEQLNLIQARYIKEIRQYVIDERTRLDEDYAKYIRRCLR